MQNTYKALLIKNTNAFNGGSIQPPMRVVRLHSRGKQTSDGIVHAVNTYNTLNSVLAVVKKHLCEFDTTLSEHNVQKLDDQLAEAVNQAIAHDNTSDVVKAVVNITATNLQEYEIHLELIPTTVDC